MSEEFKPKPKTKSHVLCSQPNDRFNVEYGFQWQREVQVRLEEDGMVYLSILDRNARSVIMTTITIEKFADAIQKLIEELFNRDET